MRIRWLALAICLLLAVGAVPRATPTFASPNLPGSYYLALGDSLGTGFEADGIPIDMTCQAADAPGYVCGFYRYLKQINPQIQLNNLSIGSVDSCVLVHGKGNGSPCTDPLISGSAPSQLDEAVQFIKAHPGAVSPITIDVGGDDLLPLLPAAAADPTGTAARLPAIMQTFQANLDTALSTLRAAAPNAEIIVATQYNPLGGIGAPPLPAGLPDLATAAINTLNSLMKQEAQKNNALVADVAAAFDAHPGGAALLTFVPTTLAAGPSKVDIHPTADGYALYTQTVEKASGYAVPLKVQAHLAKKQVATGKSEKVSGTTTAGATLTVKVWLPKRKVHSVSATAGSDGSFAKSFKVGKVAGKGSVQVCASDSSGQSVCSARMSYTIR